MVRRRYGAGVEWGLIQSVLCELFVWEKPLTYCN